MTKKPKVRVVYTPEQFKEKGFDGEIGQYMLHHKNTALVGKKNWPDERLADPHVVEFDSWDALREYERKLNA